MSPPIPYRSATTTQGRRMAGARALWRATGMKTEDFSKPIVAIANSFTQFVPGHVHLHPVGQQVDVVRQRIDDRHLLLARPVLPNRSVILADGSWLALRICSSRSSSFFTCRGRADVCPDRPRAHRTTTSSSRYASRLTDRRVRAANSSGGAGSTPNVNLGSRRPA